MVAGIVVVGVQSNSSNPIDALQHSKAFCALQHPVCVGDWSGAPQSAIPFPISMISLSKAGLWCRAGGFHVDPWRPVDVAVITHAHADHARPGSALYIASHDCVPLLRHRLPRNVPILGVQEGQRFRMGDTWVSLHPAGHILGSVQVRVELGSRVWVFSGDYKRDPDPTCRPFEVVPCDTFITEATFGLPIYHWEPCAAVAASIAAWIDNNRAEGRVSILLCYALGKAQRLLAELHPWLGDEPVWLHGAMLPLVDVYRRAGVVMAPTRGLGELSPRQSPPPGLVMAPPSAIGNRSWMRRFRQPSVAFASGWMRLRGNRQRRACDRGFVVSDHADWPSLLRTVRETGADRVLVTHGRSDILVRYLREVDGLDAAALDTLFLGDDDTGAASVLPA